MVGRSLKAAEKLKENGVEVRIVELHTIKPLDVDLIVDSARSTSAVVTAEEHSRIGGLGSAVCEVLAEHFPVPVERVGIADAFCPTGRDVDALLDACGLGVTDIVSAVHRVINRKAG
jgi:transketolase